MSFHDLTENRICLPTVLRELPERRLEEGVWKRKKVIKLSLLKRWQLWATGKK